MVLRIRCVTYTWSLQLFKVADRNDETSFGVYTYEQDIWYKRFHCPNVWRFHSCFGRNLHFALLLSVLLTCLE